MTASIFKSQQKGGTDEDRRLKLIFTHIVELFLVSVQRVVLSVFSLAVFVGDEAPSLFIAARGCQGLTWRNVSCPETVYPFVAQQQEHLRHR